MEDKLIEDYFIDLMRKSTEVKNTLERCQRMVKSFRDSTLRGEFMLWEWDRKGQLMKLTYVQEAGTKGLFTTKKETPRLMESVLIMDVMVEETCQMDGVAWKKTPKLVESQVVTSRCFFPKVFKCLVIVEASVMNICIGDYHKTCISVMKPARWYIPQPKLFIFTGIPHLGPYSVEEVEAVNKDYRQFVGSLNPFIRPIPMKKAHRQFV